MASTVLLPEDFSNYLSVENAALRFKEAAEVAEKITARGSNCTPTWITRQSSLIRPIWWRDH